MMKKAIAFLLVGFAAACNQPGKMQDEQKQMPTAGKDSVSGVQRDTVAEALKALDFAVKKDLVCGMPVSAGVEDTAHYKGKIYGFCAKECKDDFLKNPEQYLTTKK